MELDEIRDKILQGILQREYYDNKEVYNFLLLLKQPKHQEQKEHFIQLTKEEWKNEVKRAKKRSTLLIYSRQTYALYKFALACLWLTIVLVIYYNCIIKYQYFPKR